VAPLVSYIVAGVVVVLLLLIFDELRTLRAYVGSLSTGQETAAELRELKGIVEELLEHASERASSDRLAEERYQAEHPYVVPPYLPEPRKS
jgi:hypothetical protein